MPLPNSGPLSMSMVRTEMSQSNVTNYAFSDWASGTWGGPTPAYFYAPVNVSSLYYSPQTTFFTGSVYNGVSMSQWYSYNHTTSLALGVTASLIRAVDDYCYASTMLIFDAGTSSMTLSISISGSVGVDTGNDGGPGFALYYGKPWDSNGVWTGSAIPITGSLTGDVSTFMVNPNMKFNYNYVYDPNKGRYLYAVYYVNNCYAP